MSRYCGECSCKCGVGVITCYCLFLAGLVRDTFFDPLLKFKLYHYPELTRFAGCLYKGRNRGLGALSRSSLKGVRVAGLRRVPLAEWIAEPAWPQRFESCRSGGCCVIWSRWERRGEADLSTKQNRAQAPARVSCSDGDRRWPQGYRGAARARSQTAVRVKSFDNRF
jgi:hypothetical protein